MLVATPNPAVDEAVWGRDLPMSYRCCGVADSTRLRMLRLAEARPGFLLLLMCVPFLHPSRLMAQGNEAIRDVSGEYHFLTADDTLGLLEEEGKIKGYIEVYQGEEESDTVLSYPITIGTRQKNHVEFKTAKIHQKYYRFSGTAERGRGHEEGDPDYLRLVGDLEIITMKADSGQESTDRRHVIFQSKGRSEREQ